MSDEELKLESLVILWFLFMGFFAMVGFCVLGGAMVFNYSPNWVAIPFSAMAVCGFVELGIFIRMILIETKP